MEKKTESVKILYCFGCLCTNDENRLHSYTFECAHLRAMFQVDCIYLCSLCKRMAQHTEMFIQNVQSNQVLLDNVHAGDNTLQRVRNQIQPLVSLTHIPLPAIELSENDVNIEESFSIICSSSSREAKVKLEMKEEEVEDMPDHLEGEFINGDDEFQDSYVKEEDEFKLLFKEKLELDIDLLSLRNTLKEGKVKKKSRKNLDECMKSDVMARGIPKIKKKYITKKQCMQERKQMAKDKKYLNSTYKCQDCVKGFNFNPSYEKHLEKHSESRGEFTCNICKQRMNSEEKLVGHKKYHMIRYQCPACDLTRVNRLTIKDHYTATHCQGYFQYICPHCSKAFKRQVSLRKHIGYMHRQKERVSCAYCHKSYASKEVLKSHMIVTHPNEVSAGEVRKRYTCQDCSMAFKAPSQLKNHRVKHSHSRNYYCVECDKSFKSDSILKHHLKTAMPHINYIELPLVCLHCEKRFAIRRDLDRHTNRVHLNIKPFQCDRCEKAYVNGWSLSEHKRLVHEGYKRPLKFPCPMCDKIFDRKQILKGHIRTHTGERPYQCSICPAQFSQASSLGTHVKLIHLKLTRDGRPKAVSVK